MSSAKSSETGGKKTPRKVSNYLLDRDLQLRYVVSVTVFSAVLCAVLGYLIYQQEADASQAIVEIATSADLSPEIAGAVSQRLDGDDGRLVLNMILVGVGLAVLLSLYLLVLTHKVAGPLFKISRYFSQMESGVLGRITPLRKRDMLKDFYQQFSESHESLRSRFSTDNQVIKDVLSEARKSVSNPDTAPSATKELLEEANTHALNRQVGLSG